MIHEDAEAPTRMECPHCEEMISVNAKWCPECGRAVTPRRPSLLLYLGIAGLVVLIGTAGIVLSMLATQSKEPPKAIAAKQEENRQPIRPVAEKQPVAETPVEIEPPPPPLKSPVAPTPKIEWKRQLKPMHAGTLEVGQLGQFERTYRFTAKKILGPQEVLVNSFAIVETPRVGKFKGQKKATVSMDAEERQGLSFVVRGLPTDRMADRSPVPLVGLVRVVSTKTIGASTFFVVEPAPDDPSK